MKTVKLNELCHIHGGIPAPKVTAQVGQVPFIRMRELGASHLSSDFRPNQEYLIQSDEEIFESKIHNEGAILFPRSGSVHLNHRALLRTKAAIVSHIGALVPKVNVDPTFLYHLLTDYDMTEIMTQTTGLNMIKFGQLAEVEFEVPESIQEQTKIAAVLSTVDRAIEQAEALIAKQQRIKTGLMQDLLTRGIDEHGNLRSEETHEFKDSPLGRIPVEWQAIPISEVGIWYSGATPPKSNGRFWGGEIPWICPKDMKQFELYKSIDTITELAVESGIRLVASGAVIVVIRGMILAHTFPVGYTTADVAFNQDVKAVIARKGLSGRFLAYWLVARSNEFLKLTTTATHGTKRFDMEEFQSQPFGLPPACEQKMIVRILDDQQKSFDETKGQLAKFQAQKTALMQDLLTGKRRVTPLLNASGA